MELKYFKPKVGENIIRILPLKIKELCGDANDLFLYDNEPFAYPNLEHLCNQKKISCLEMWKEVCPVEQEMEKRRCINRHMFTSVPRYYMNVLVEGHVHVWCVGQSIYEKLNAYKKMAMFRGFISPENGIDCHLFRKGERIQTRYQIVFAHDYTSVEIPEPLYDFSDVIYHPLEEEISDFLTYMKKGA